MNKYALVLKVLLGWLLLHQPLAAQEKPGLIKRAFNAVINDTSSIERPKFIAYPTVAYAPETKWEFGASALYVYYANRDTLNRLSEINAFTFVTLESQNGLWLDHALYSDQSKRFFLGKLRFQRFPLIYYGIGPRVSGEELAIIDAGSIAIRERVLRKITGGLYLGLEMDYQRLSNVSVETLSGSGFDRPRGLGGYSNFGLGLGLVYDNRHNVLNVREGFFGETGFLRYDESWGSDFNFTNYFLDARYYLPVNDNQVFASQLFFSNVEGEAPFNQLALLGGETLMRGYYTGRYRDNTYLAGQVEYRFLPLSFSKRWGAAAFFGAGTVGNNLGDLQLENVKIAGGVGVRFLIFKSKDIYTRFDIAFSEDGPGFYFFVGEAF